MREEDVTKAIMRWLTDNGWEIVCFDFPQSGTGKQLHPNNSTSKTEGIVIPDIVSARNGVVVIFENKDRFEKSDFDKVNWLRSTQEYSQALDSLLRDIPHHTFRYGIGIPLSDDNRRKANELADNTDFVVFVKDNGTVIPAIDHFGVFKKSEAHRMQ